MRPIHAWPRLLVRSNAAAYVDLSEAAFEREVAAGRLPNPVRLGGKDHWSRVALDECVERLAGERHDDWTKNNPFFGGRNAA